MRKTLDTTSCSWDPPEPVEWFKFSTVIRNPDGKNDYGQVDENLYSITSKGLLTVTDMEGRQIGTYQLRKGDEILAADRAVVRQRSKRTAFHDPLPPTNKRTA